VCHNKGKALMESIEKTILRKIFGPEKQDIREVQFEIKFLDLSTIEEGAMCLQNRGN